MKIRMMLVASLALLGVTAPAHAVNMFAGPLYAEPGDGCECKLVNITTVAKTVRVQLIRDDGLVINDSFNVSLAAGRGITMSGGNSGSQYCKFTNASPAYFRGTISCFGTVSNSDQVAAPAQ